MKKMLMIASRELKNRIRSRGFFFLAIVGPLVVVAFLFTAIWNGLGEVEKTNVLVEDPYGVFKNFLRVDSSSNVDFFFTDELVDNKDFLKNDIYKNYNIKLEINQKVLENNTVIMVYKKLPAWSTESFIRRVVQNNLEEMKALRFDYASLDEYYNIKQPIELVSYDAEHGIYGDQKRESVIVGVFFSVLIFIFIFIFSVQVMRSILEEKSSRVVEILASSVKAHQLLLGKIIGVAAAGILQFAIWCLLIFGALYFIRMNYFPDIYDPSIVASMQGGTENLLQNYSSVIDLIYQRINFGLMLPIFLIYFIGGYLLYGSIYAALGGVVRAESDSQSFLIPVSIPLFLSVIFVFTLIFDSNQSNLEWTSIFPLTSPVVMPVRVALGFEQGTVWELYVSILTLISTFVLMIYLSSKIYGRGMLNYTGKVKLSTIWKWLKY